MIYAFGLNFLSILCSQIMHEGNMTVDFMKGTVSSRVMTGYFINVAGENLRNILYEKETKRSCIRMK